VLGHDQPHERLGVVWRADLHVASSIGRDRVTISVMGAGGGGGAGFDRTLRSSSSSSGSSGNNGSASSISLGVTVSATTLAEAAGGGMVKAAIARTKEVEQPVKQAILDAMEGGR